MLHSYREQEFSPGGPEGLPTLATNLTIDPSIWYDSCAFKGYDNSGGIGAWANYKRVYSGGHVSQQSVSSWSGLSNSFLYDTTNLVYDASGKLIKTGGSPNNTSTDPVTYYRTYGSYGVVKDSAEFSSNTTPILYKKVNYEYDASGNLSTANTYLWEQFPGASWRIVARDTFSYDVSNKLITHLNIIYGSSATYIYADSFSYTGNNLTYRVMRNWDSIANGWTGSYITKSYFNSLNDLDSQLIGSETVTGFVEQQKYVFNYNSFRHFTTVNLNYMNNMGTQMTHNYRFYYEIYDPASINTPTLPSFGAGLYPNPAQDKVYIRFKVIPKSPVIISVYNTAGQLVQQYAQGDLLNEITTEKLAAGVYHVELSNGERKQSLKFVKD